MFLKRQELIKPVQDELYEAVEKVSKKSENDWSGRNSQSITVVFPKENYKIGDFVNVKINSCTSATLIGKAIGLSKNN